MNSLKQTEFIPHTGEPKERPESVGQEVARLRAEIARIREALEKVRERAIEHDHPSESEYVSGLNDALRIVESAMLNDKDKGHGLERPSQKLRSMTIRKVSNSLRQAFFLSIALLGSIVFLMGCSQAAARAKVMATYPGAEVINVPDEPYRWLIRKPDGSVWYCYNATGSEGIHHMELFPAR